MNSINASLCYNDIKNERCFMELRKDAIDLTGKRFGKLTALRVNPRKSRGVSWWCECECGKITSAYGGHLRSGQRVSCGCIGKRNIYINAIKFLYDTYKRKAKKRKIIFELIFEDFKILVQGNCYFCNQAPYQEIKKQQPKETRIIYIGIDRLNNKIGYTKENCVSCCKYCNYAKSDLSLNEFKNHIKRIYEWLLTDF